MKTFLILNKQLLALIIILVSIIVLPKNVLAKTSCTVITKNLSRGSTNSNSGLQVMSLQKFLYSEGYLSTSPTGLYGSLTVNAIKKFQKAKGLSAIGSTGPLTRAAIRKDSCFTSTTINTITNNISPSLISPKVIVPVDKVSSVPAGNLFTAPSLGTQLTIGDTFQIEWTGNNHDTVINILLESENGTGAGYIATNISSINHYIWTVGSTSSTGQQIMTAPPGNYRIKIIDQLSNNSSLNIKSEIFSIKERPLSISSIMPSIAPADGKTEVMLYGDGFNSLSKVKLEGMSNLSIIPQYFSPNGNLTWFYIPTYIIPGIYRISVYNDYSSLNTSLTSNSSNYASLQITSN